MPAMFRAHEALPQFVGWTTLYPSTALRSQWWTKKSIAHPTKRPAAYALNPPFNAERQAS